MKALILNSGKGSRMGDLTSKHPKCMTEIASMETIISRQLRQVEESGIKEVVITTGPFEDKLINYVESLGLDLDISFVCNPLYEDTNYIYSIYLARAFLNDTDLLLLHGDLVIENAVFFSFLEQEGSLMAGSTTKELPEKDFKAEILDGYISKVGISGFNYSYSVEPFYKLTKEDWEIWLSAIIDFCERRDDGDEEQGRKEKENLDGREPLGHNARFVTFWQKQYAEEALNTVLSKMNLKFYDIDNQLCQEVDNPEDLAVVVHLLSRVKNRTVYLCFSSDILYNAHFELLRQARRIGKVIVGVLTDEVVSSYKRYPLLSFSQRKEMFENIAGVDRVVEQDSLSYRKNLEYFKPDFVIHGDDWQHDFQKPIRDEVCSVLAEYGGKLVEFPYVRDEKYRDLEKRSKAELAMPDFRRGRLRRELNMKGFVRVMEAHDGITGLIVENTKVYKEGAAHQFDAMWVSSLCDSTAKGKPDIELVDMSSRFRTIEDITEITTKPIIFDGDTGGIKEHFVYTVRSLERLGVSMVIIEDKKGLKKNSLFGTEVEQTQDSIESFSEKIRAGKNAQRTKEFMICARIESLILEKGMDDALDRAFAFVDAGADAIMIHSRKKEPAEIFTFVERFRTVDKETYIVVVPTSFNTVKEEEFKARGVNVVIYANQLMRASVPAMENAAKTILVNERAAECDKILMPFSEIIRLIPEEN